MLAKESSIASVSSTIEFINSNGIASFSETATVLVKLILVMLSLLRWVASFLHGTAQVTRVGVSVSAPWAPALNSWTVLEVVPRNSPSLLNVVVDDIHAFAVNNNMRLKPRICKTMNADFLLYNSCVPRPIAVGWSDIDQISTFKLPGVFLSEDLTWTVHCDYIVKKANRRLYPLRQLMKCKVPSAGIVHIYCALIRSDTV